MDRQRQRVQMHNYQFYLKCKKKRKAEKQQQNAQLFKKSKSYLDFYNTLLNDPQPQNPQSDEPQDNQGESVNPKAEVHQTLDQNTSNPNLFQIEDPNNPDNVRLNKLNLLYLKHLKGDCICMKCKCGKCRCPNLKYWHNGISLPQSQQSSYQSQFHAHALLRSQIVPPKILEYSPRLPHIDNISSNRSDYKEWNPSVSTFPVQNLSSSLCVGGGGVEEVESTYKQSFKKQECLERPERVRPLNQINILPSLRKEVGLTPPFQKVQQRYEPIDKGRHKNESQLKKMFEQNPFRKEYESLYKDSFRRHKVSYSVNVNHQPISDHQGQQMKYQNHYVSTSRREFKAIQQQFCEARVELLDLHKLINK